jgi:hypothetical protein
MMTIYAVTSPYFTTISMPFSKLNMTPLITNSICLVHYTMLCQDLINPPNHLYQSQPHLPSFLVHPTPPSRILFSVIMLVPNHTPSALLPLYPLNILSRHSIPSSHIFLHTSRETCFLAAGEGGRGFWDAAFEAVFIYFLP